MKRAEKERVKNDIEVAVRKYIVKAIMVAMEREVGDLERVLILHNALE